MTHTHTHTHTHTLPYSEAQMIPPTSYVPAVTNEDRDINNFKYHQAKGSQPERYEANRSACLGLATLLRSNCPLSRELSVAITKLEEVMFWANAAIARNE